MSFEINDSNYSEWNRIAQIILNHQQEFINLQIGENANQVEKELENPETSIPELKKRVTDIILSLKDFPFCLKAKIDAELKDQKLPDIGELQSMIIDSLPEE